MPDATHAIDTDMSEDEARALVDRMDILEKENHALAARIKELEVGLTDAVAANNADRIVHASLSAKVEALKKELNSLKGEQGASSEIHEAFRKQVGTRLGAVRVVVQAAPAPVGVRNLLKDSNSNLASSNPNLATGGAETSRIYVSQIEQQI
ncbi:hypothetical protein HK104_010405 [Borealophlyctis nickersoniae]|nr:hypothetical protein HK104_010405 [Borealophlyctis nickersoniae]